MKVCESKHCHKSGQLQPMDCFAVESMRCKVCVAKRERNIVEGNKFFIANQETIELSIMNEENKLFNASKVVRTLNKEFHEYDYHNIYKDHVFYTIKTLKGLVI